MVESSVAWLPGIYWLLTANQGMYDHYGVKGRVRRIEQRKPWNIGLNDLPNHESFDVEFSPSGLFLQINSYNMAGVFTGSELFEYDDSGKTTRSTRLDEAGRRIAIYEFKRKTESNETITTTESDGKLASRTVEIVEGGLVTFLALYGDDRSLRQEKRFQYSDSRLHSSESRFFAPGETLAERWLTSYDAAGRVARTFGLKANGEPLGDGKYKYEYDSEGRVSRLWTFDDFGSDESATSVKVYEYIVDASGNWVERREFHRSRSDTRWSTQTTSRNLMYYPLD